MFDAVRRLVCIFFEVEKLPKIFCFEESASSVNDMFSYLVQAAGSNLLSNLVVLSQSVYFTQNIQKSQKRNPTNYGVILQTGSSVLAALFLARTQQSFHFSCLLKAFVDASRTSYLLQLSDSLS